MNNLKINDASNPYSVRLVFPPHANFKLMTQPEPVMNDALNLLSKEFVNWVFKFVLSKDRLRDPHDRIEVYFEINPFKG